MTASPSVAPATARARPADEATWWRSTGRALVGKALAELAYEGMLMPTQAGPGGWCVELPGAPPYAFRARRGGFGTWRIDPASITRGGRPAEDPVQLMLDAAPVLGLDGPTAAEVVRELTATHAADVRLRATAHPSRVLAELGYAELEQHLDGHPVLVLNKGRLGFTGADLDRYAPESREVVRLRWYAAHRSVAGYSGVSGLRTQDRLLAEELGAAGVAALAGALADRVAEPAAYVWLPVHPYQDETVVRTLFAPHLGDRRLVFLGEIPVAYRPVQSVRTLAAPGHRDVKVPLYLRNTLVWRGLGGRATAAAPEISEWLGSLAADPRLAATGMGLLREVAAVVVRHGTLDAIPGVPYRYTELLGALWRDPVAGRLEPGERARSLAALLHVDPDGRSLLAELVERSGCEPRVWLRRLCDALLPGLLYCLTAHGVAFCPHGENTVVVYDERDLPIRILVKDFAEDVNLLPGRDYPGLGPLADAALVRWPLDELAHSIISAVFAGHFRFLAGVVEDHLGLPERDFWALVREALLDWRSANPDLAEPFDGLGLLAPRVTRIALNREHLTGSGFHDRAERDGAPDVTFGHAKNPLADPAGRR